MDSTSIYLTGSTRKIFKDTPRFEDIHPADLELAWYKLDGTRICNAQVKPTWPPSSPAQKHDMRDFDSQNRVFLNDAILCYDFSKPWNSQVEENEEISMFVPQLSEEEELNEILNEMHAGDLNEGSEVASIAAGEDEEEMEVAVESP